MTPGCFLIREHPANGRSVLWPQEIVIRRTAAIGDSIAASVIATKLNECGVKVVWQTHNLVSRVMRRHPHIDRVIEPGGFCHINLDGAYENYPFRCSEHFHEIFMRVANEQLARIGVNLGAPINCRPRLTVQANTKQAAVSRLEGHPKPWVFICPRSEHYSVRQVPDALWIAIAKKIQGTAFWIGLHPAPEGIIDLRTHNLDLLMDLLSAAHLLVSVDTGPMHIANALGVPVLAIGQSSSPELHLSDQTDFRTISPIEPPLDCLNCQKNVCPKSRYNPPCQQVDPDQVASWINLMVKSSQGERIGCVIPIYRPKAEVLNRCLKAVLPQVDEVVITMELGGKVPDGTLFDPKIVRVMKPASKIGFGRNVNFGMRHSIGKYVLVLNDDVYLAPDAVAKMMQCMKPRTGVVGQLLRYPDGTIYHAGKRRQLGGSIGFPHVDLRKHEPSIKAPMEMENTNGASFLFRREAFYDADGYDEGFLFYAEDDDICMKIRRAGWQVWYTPLATGIHDEHHETRNLPDRMQIMSQSNARFAEKWREYFQHNARNPGLGNFNYIKP